MLAKCPPNMPRWSVDVAAIALLTITGWIAFGNHLSTSTLDAFSGPERQGGFLSAQPSAARSAPTRVRVGQPEVDYIAADTIRHFTDEVASQRSWTGYQEVNFGEDVTVRYFAPINMGGTPMRPVANLAQPAQRSSSVSDKSVTRKLAE